jgi:hypothetical protein
MLKKIKKQPHVSTEIAARAQGPASMETTHTGNTTPVPRFFSHTQNQLKTRIYFQITRSICTFSAMERNGDARKTNLGTILCNLFHPTKKHDFDKFTLTSNEIMM